MKSKMIDDMNIVGVFIIFLPFNHMLPYKTPSNLKFFSKG